MQILTADTVSPRHEPAYLANGLIGLRVPSLPTAIGKAYVNGYTGMSPELNSETYEPCPYPLGLDIVVGETTARKFPNLLQFQEQQLDMRSGELTSCFMMHTGAGSISVEVLTLCSRSLPTLVMQQVKVRVDQAMALTLEARIDHAGLPGQLLRQYGPQRQSDGIVHYQSRGDLGSVGLAYWAELVSCDCDLQERCHNNFGHEEDAVRTLFKINAEPGAIYRVQQLAAVVPSELHCEPHWQAHRVITTARELGFAQLRAANQEAWNSVWKGRLQIHCNDSRWQEMADAAHFYLHSSCHQASIFSVAPFGLSDNYRYGGRVFWDTETFMFPPVLLTQPEAARAMLDYRFRLLDDARRTAVSWGRRGLQFPWQSLRRGVEMTSYYTDGHVEYHNSFDIAYAFLQYAWASGDDWFRRERTWPVVQGVADWTTSLVRKTARGYEIHALTGPDEMRHYIDNNAFTNIMARIILREAQKLSRQLGYTPPRLWATVEAGLYIPMRDQVIWKNDSYEDDGGVCIPETLVAYFPYGYQHNAEVDQATYKWYLDRVHTYLGGPMFSALCGVWAARLGNRRLSRDMFEAGVLCSIQKPFHLFGEAAPGKENDIPWGGSQDTCFLSNLAGFLMSGMYGLTGLQLSDQDPQQWCRRPIVMPEGWQGIEVEQLQLRGQSARLTARHGAAHAVLQFD